jgi:drug/metabolite transporter (DMT)-like permease
MLLAVWLASESLWPRDWTALVLMSLGSQIVGQGLIMYAVTRTSPLIVGLMLLTQPIIAAAIGWIGYGEALESLDLVGGLAIGGAVLLVRGSETRLPSPGKPPRSAP